MIDNREDEVFSDDMDDYQIKKSISIHHKVLNSIDNDVQIQNHNYKVKVSPGKIKTRSNSMQILDGHSNMIKLGSSFIHYNH